MDYAQLRALLKPLIMGLKDVSHEWQLLKPRAL